MGMKLYKIYCAIFGGFAALEWDELSSRDKRKWEIIASDFIEFHEKEERDPGAPDLTNYFKEPVTGRLTSHTPNLIEPHEKD